VIRASTKLRGLLALLVLGSLVLVPAGSLASGSTSNWIGVAQTVIVSTEATGKISATPKPTVFTQFSANGKGPATLKVPMSSSGFRNLSALAKPPIEDGYAVWRLHLNGPTHQRTIAHFPTDKLPLKVTAAYELNGKKMQAKDIVGKSGLLKVSYVVENVTTADTKVTYKSVLGAEVTQTVKAPIPIAGALNVTIPATFTNLDAPGAGSSGNGNGTSTASWTMFLFNPLGGVKQSVSYQAHVTDAAVPSATLEAQALPPSNVKPLPTISEPGAPSVPTITLGGKLASLQSRFQSKLSDLSAKAAAVLAKFQAIAVPAAQSVSGKAAELAANLPTSTTAAQKVATVAEKIAAHLTTDAAVASHIAGRAASLQAGLGEAAAEANEHVGRVHEAKLKLEAVPPLVQRTNAYKDAVAVLVALEGRLAAHAAHLEARAADAKELEGALNAHAAGLEERAANAKELQLSALTASTNLTEHVAEDANSLSAQAAETATTLEDATLKPGKKSAKAIQPKQVGGGAHLDAAVGQLDAAITGTATKVDNEYAYLTALDKRAGENLLPAGNAIGATAQAGAFVYEIAGANNTEHELHLAGFVGGFALTLGIMLGIGLYRVRRGLPSSMKPPKSPPAPAKG
jgi:putative membrane protein